MIQKTFTKKRLLGDIPANYGGIPPVKENACGIPRGIMIHMINNNGPIQVTESPGEPE